jgi:predicted RNA binding protein YcfA (HicA-like mRNA interferase family)
MGVKELPLDSGRAHRKVFESFGWILRRSEKNHFILTHPNNERIFISIPDHDEVDRFLLHTEIRKAGLTDREYRARYDDI